MGRKAQLVVKALRHGKPGHADEIDTGSLRGDLHALVALEDDCTMERNSALMRGVAMAMHHNEDLRQAFREQVIDRRWAGSGRSCGVPWSGGKSVRTAPPWSSRCT